jgi:glutamyl-tRNA synthetase
VLVRADGSYLYSFTSVVDDIAFAITHVIRGEDHVTNSGAQIQMFRALGASEPAFAHLPLLVDAAGGGLSKRTGSLSVGELRERGIEALAIAALLARLGTADPVEPVTSLETLVATVDLARVGRATARFSEEELAHLSARTLHLLPYEAVRDRLPPGVSEALWLAVRGNLTTLVDASAWAAIVTGSLAPVLEDPGFLEEAATRLPAEPWGETTWKEWTGAVSVATQRKGRALFHPLRLALTARETGPEMGKLLPLIGRTKAAARLRGQTA